MLRRIAHSIPPVARLKERIEVLEQANLELQTEITALHSELSLARGHLTEAASELDEVCFQRDAVCSERDGLNLHLNRLELENAGFRDQVAALYAEVDEMRSHAERLTTEVERAENRFDTVSVERDELREHAARLDHRLRQLEEFSRAAPPGHFYSPLIDVADPHVRIALDNPAGLSDLPGFRPQRLIDHHHALMKHAARLDLVLRATPGHRYYLENDFFSYADAIAYACVLMEYRPRRVVEVGCGFSSYLAMDVNERNLDCRSGMAFIDPRAPWHRLAADDPYRPVLRPSALQDVALDLFEELEPDDVLFYDGSHVAKTGSDVNHFFFHVLPRIKPGVLIHIHDVFYPFEYPRHWVLDERRNWNEVYLLRAYLQHNEQVEWLVFNDYLYRKHPELAEEPLALRNTGSSFWFRKTKEN